MIQPMKLSKQIASLAVFYQLHLHYTMDKIKIALISHDGKKPEMVSFVNQHRDFLTTHTIVYATGTTGSHIEKEGFAVHRLLSGPMGGDAQIGAMVAVGDLDLIIFFRDPLDKHPHEPDVQMLLRLCDVHNIPLATNRKSAFYILRGIASAYFHE